MRRTLVLVVACLACTAGRRVQGEEPRREPREEMPTLVVLPVDRAPAVDGDGTDAAWKHAPVLVVTATAQIQIGMSDPMRADLELRACATKDATFLLLRWADAQADEEAAPGGPTALGDADGLALGWHRGDVAPDGFGEKPDNTRWSADAKAAPGPDVVRGTWRDGRWTTEVQRSLAPGAPGFLTVDLYDTARGAALARVRLRWGSAARVLTFDGETVGEAPKGLRGGLAGEGRPGSWRVRPAEGGAGGNVVIQEDAAGEGARFPLLVLESTAAGDVDVSVRFQARGGAEDRGAGLIWRARGERDFYVVRANALEENLVPYVTKDGVRTPLPVVGRGDDYGVSVAFDPAGWHVLRATAVGDRLQAYLDGTLVLDVVDGTLRSAGSVGLWTKADSVIAFDDLVVVTLDPAAPAPGR